MNQLGALVVSLGLNAADFIDGMTKAEQRAQRFSSNLSNQIAIGVAKAEVALRALGVVAQTAINAFPTLVDQVGKFQDISERIGDSSEAVASLAVAAKIGGVEMEALADISVKLNKNLTGVDDESKAAGAALKSLGINIKDFKQLAPTDQIEKLAKALAGFKEGPQKATVLEALAKGGSQLLPFLKELADGTGRVNTLTREQIQLADEFADKTAKSRAELNLLAQQLAIGAIPTIDALTEAGKDVVKQLLGIQGAGRDLKASREILDFAENGAIALGTLIEAMIGVAKAARAIGGSFESVWADIKVAAQNATPATLAKNLVTGDLFDQLAERNKVAAEANQRYQDLWTYNGTFVTDAIRKSFAEQRKALAGNGISAGDFARSDRTSKPALVFNGANENGADVLKKQLDGELRLIRDFLQDLKAEYAFQIQYQRNFYDDGLQSFREYSAKAKDLREKELQAQVDALDKEIAALAKFRDAASKPQEKQDASNKIAEATAKRASAVAEASRKEILANQENARTVRELSDAYSGFQAQLLSLRGDSLGAALLSNSIQAEEARRRLTQQERDPGEAQDLKRLLDLQAEQTEAQRQFGLITDEVRRKEEEARIELMLAGKSELELLQAIGELRSASIDQLGEMAAKARELADAIGSPEAKARAAQMALEWKKAMAEANPVLKRVQDTGKEIGSTIANGVEDWITGAKSLRDVLRGIEQDILRIMSRRLVTEPLGNWLSNLIGGNGTPSGGGGWLGSILGGAFGMGGGGVNLGTVTGADLGVAFATGGVAEPRSMHQVNERGPELLDVNGRQFLMMGNQRGRVTPMSAGGAGMTVVVHQSFAPGASRETFAQAATALTRSLRVHSARNG
jgi:hypothetical protein